MRFPYLILVASLVCALPAAAKFPAQGWQQSTDKVEVIQPVVYGTGGGRELRAAIYIPRTGNEITNSVVQLVRKPRVNAASIPCPELSAIASSDAG